MVWMKLKEFLRGTDCWNCKSKKDCLSYQATKYDSIIVTNCKNKK